MKAAGTTKRFGASRRLAIQVLLEMLHGARRLGIAPAPRGRGVIFTLHHVRPSAAGSAFSPNAHLEVTPDFLDAGLAALLQEGYEPVTLDDIPARLAASGDRRFFAVTLDDGYRDNRDHALPVFRRHGVPFTVFVTKGFIERTHTMWWRTAEALVAGNDSVTLDPGGGSRAFACASPADKARTFMSIAAAARYGPQDEAIAALNEAARAAGIEPLAMVDEAVMDAAELGAFAADPLVSLGAHSVSHASLAHLDGARLADELRASAETVAAITGKGPTAFAYPYGDAPAAGPREFRAAAEAGYRLAVTTVPDVLAADSITRAPTALPRVSLNGYYQKARYVTALGSGLAFRKRTARG